LAAVILASVSIAGCSREDATQAGKNAAVTGNAAVGARSTEVLREVVTTRAVAIEAPGSLHAKLDAMPVGPMGRNPADAQQRALAWSAFFRGTLVKLGRLPSEAPVALYYNPVLDVGVLQSCNVPAKSGPVTCQFVCALPGEVLTGGALVASPRWLAEPDPLVAVTRNAGLRTAGFAKTFPPNAAVSGTPPSQLCSAKNQALAEVRVMEGLVSMAAVDPTAIGQAIGDYLSRTNAKGAPVTPADAELRGLLSHLSSLSLSGAVALADHGWVLFLTPKATGWRQVALVVGPSGKRGLKLEAAKVLSIKTEARS